MDRRAIEILALRLAEAEANNAIQQAKLEQTQLELQQLRTEQVKENSDVQTDI